MLRPTSLRWDSIAVAAAADVQAVQGNSAWQLTQKAEGEVEVVRTFALRIVTCDVLHEDGGSRLIREPRAEVLQLRVDQLI